MRLKKTGALIIIIALGFTANTLAAPPLLEVVTEEFPPYNYTIDGKIKGISTSVVTETLKRAGIKYRLRVFPWKRAYKILSLKEKNVLIYSIYRSAEREPLFAAWIGPILPPAAVNFYKLKGRTDVQASTLTDAKKYKIGVMRDDYNHELLKKQNFPDLDVASDAISNTRKFLAARVDLIPSYELTLAARLQQLEKPFGLVEKVLTLIPAEDSKIFMALSRGTDPELITKIAIAFGQVRAEGAIEKALDEYLHSVK